MVWREAGTRTLAPALARAVEKARPRPLFPPVTIAFFPAIENMFIENSSISTCGGSFRIVGMGGVHAAGAGVASSSSAAGRARILRIVTVVRMKPTTHMASKNKKRLV